MLPHAELLLTGRCQEGRRKGSLSVCQATNHYSSYLAFCLSGDSLHTLGSCSLELKSQMAVTYVLTVQFSRMFDNKRFICLFVMTTVF